MFLYQNKWHHSTNDYNDNYKANKPKNNIDPFMNVTNLTNVPGGENEDLIFILGILLRLKELIN